MPLKTPLRILYINPISRQTGAEVTLLELMEHLPADRFQPVLLCPSEGPLTEVTEKRNIKTLILPSLPAGGRAIDNFRKLPQNALKIAKIIHDNKIALVHSNTPRAAYHGGSGARLAGVPSVIHVRDYRQPPFTSKAKCWFLNTICDRVIVVSLAAQKAISPQVKALARKVNVIFDGIPTAPCLSTHRVQTTQAEFGKTGQNYLLVQVGWIEELKGQEIALKAMPLILNKFPQTKLLFVGEALDGAGVVYKQQLDALAHDLGIMDHIVFTGLRQDVPVIMAGMDLLIHPAVLPDALPHVLLEAGAQAKPVVASAIGGIPEIIVDGKTGMLIPSGDPESLAEAVNELLSNPIRRYQMGQLAFERMNSVFSIQQHVEKVIAIYNELLSL